MDELGTDEMGKVAGGTHANCLTLPNVAMCVSFRVCNVTHQLECQAPSVLPDTCLC